MRKGRLLASPFSLVNLQSHVAWYPPFLDRTLSQYTPSLASNQRPFEVREEGLEFQLTSGSGDSGWRKEKVPARTIQMMTTRWATPRLLMVLMLHLLIGLDYKSPYCY